VVLSRKVAAILFLNGERQAPGTATDARFDGGFLNLFDLTLDLPEWTVVPEAGLLIAFPADVPHEVTPVLSGQRFTAVTWYT
jgi:predicted 2-oxoglutarate/Fe(II)-dependent dioxygenase YbiX